MWDKSKAEMHASNLEGGSSFVILADGLSHPSSQVSCSVAVPVPGLLLSS